MKNNKMERIVDIDKSDHYTWGENCDGWHFVKTENLSIIRETMPKGTQEKKHFHERALQFFYILSGEASFEIEGQIYVVLENQGITIKPKEKHKIMNNTDFDLKFLVISNPPSHGDRINLE
jgi:mannose-6-phosphate isomerase-like protein (cupin superfamily)